MTEDLQRRLSEHRRGTVRWTRSRLPAVLAYHEQRTSRLEARDREKYLKSGWGKWWLRQKLAKADQVDFLDGGSRVK